MLARNVGELDEIILGDLRRGFRVYGPEGDLDPTYLEFELTSTGCDLRVGIEGLSVALDFSTPVSDQDEVAREVYERAISDPAFPLKYRTALLALEGKLRETAEIISDWRSKVAPDSNSPVN
jgi:hypothetical protein